MYISSIPIVKVQIRRRKLDIFGLSAAQNLSGLFRCPVRQAPDVTFVEFPIILPTKETRCRQNSQAVRSEIRPRWRCRFVFQTLTGSAKVGRRLHGSSFRYRSRGRDATTVIGFVGGTPPVYSVRHDLILMSSWVHSREHCFSTPSIRLFWNAFKLRTIEENLRRTVQKTWGS
jgi:hypothetical protein